LDPGLPWDVGTRTYILLGSWPLAAKVSGESPLTALEGRKVVGDSRTEF